MLSHPCFYLCKALALAQSGKWPLAKSLLENTDLRENSFLQFCPVGMDWKWTQRWIRAILHWKPKLDESRRVRATRSLPDKKPAAVPAAAVCKVQDSVSSVALLPRYAAKIPIRFTLPDAAAYHIVDRSDSGSAADFILRLDLAHASLFQTLDELLCLPDLRGVDIYWHQVETARKVLKQFHGRVLLADEVGLGKTVEAGMVLKEYMLRGMAERILILTPASLVG